MILIGFYLRLTWFGSWETKFKSWVNPSLVLPQWIVCTYLFFIKIMIKPSIVLMIRQITIMWKFSFRNSLAWFLRFSLNTSLIWTMYFWILELVIARTQEKWNIHNTLRKITQYQSDVLHSIDFFSVLFNFRLSFFNCWEIVTFMESLETQ